MKERFEISIDIRSGILSQTFAHLVAEWLEISTHMEAIIALPMLIWKLYSPCIAHANANMLPGFSKHKLGSPVNQCEIYYFIHTYLCLTCNKNKFLEKGPSHCRQKLIENL